jgi:hypothetical protein
MPLNMAMPNRSMIMNTLPVSSDDIDINIAPEDAPMKLNDMKHTKLFDHNHGLINDLMEKDLHHGRSHILPKIKQTTAEQIVNLLFRSKQRRRKQIFDERIGRVRPIMRVLEF